MDKLIESAAVQVPGMAIMVIVVWIFIKYLSKRDRAIDEIHKENIAARELSRQIIEQNTHAAFNNTAALSEMTDTIRQFIEKSRRKHKRNK